MTGVNKYGENSGINKQILNVSFVPLLILLSLLLVGHMEKGILNGQPNGFIIGNKSGFVSDVIFLCRLLE